MALLHFHYLVTAAALTIWSRYPFVVMFAFWAFQAIFFIVGASTPDLTDYIFWQFLTTAAGVVVGIAFYTVTNSPRLLRFRADFVGMWAKFLIWFIFFLASQLFYGFFPPPAYPWGIVGTSIIHLLALVGVWLATMYSSEWIGLYQGKTYLFVTWIVMQLIMELLFFLAYVLAERWVAYISAGTVFILLIILRLVYPLRPAYANKREILPGATQALLKKTDTPGADAENDQEGPDNE